MKETFSPSHDMVEYMSIYWKWGKLLWEQSSTGDMDNYWSRWARAAIRECL